MTVVPGALGAVILIGIVALLIVGLVYFLQAPEQPEEPPLDPDLQPDEDIREVKEH